jgi:hypothetical protein
MSSSIFGASPLNFFFSYVVVLSELYSAPTPISMENLELEITGQKDVSA